MIIITINVILMNTMRRLTLMAVAVRLKQCDTYKHRIDVFMSPRSLTIDPTF